MTSEIRLSDLGFVRAAAAVPELWVADVEFNVRKIIAGIEEAQEKGVQIVVFPELGITGYTCKDLFFQKALQDAAEEGLAEIVRATKGSRILAIVGMPVRSQGKLFNCGVGVWNGKILGVVPKTYMPTYGEFEEERFFSSSLEAREKEVWLCRKHVPFGIDILFCDRENPLVSVGIELCEDLWIAPSPHEFQAHAGAMIFVNLSASNEIVGKAAWRRTLTSSASGRSFGAYIYTSCGWGESTNDVVFGGHAIIAENGSILKESERFRQEGELLIADIDVERLLRDRMVNNSFAHGARFVPDELKYPRKMQFSISPSPALHAENLERSLTAHPFVPSDPRERDERCKEIMTYLKAALAKKLVASGAKKVVLGLSGGLDSTLAALVLAETLDALGLPRANAHAYTLPGPGTTEETKESALSLADSLSFSMADVSIVDAVVQHLRDLGHDGVTEDTTYQNTQARYRTNFLLNKGNQVYAILLGTGDLSEIAVGWCTFGGDHLSHYHILCSVPKTLVEYIVRWYAETQADKETKENLLAILERPISPELTRPKEGKIVQKSEDEIGPRELIDFNLFYFHRYGKTPSQILYLAHVVNERGLFDTRYTIEELAKWLGSFINRFFGNQFKRTCMPEGPKIGSVSLSPRGDWRMPSDAERKLWIEDLERGHERLKGKEVAT